MTKKLRKLRENNQTLFPKMLDSQTTLDDTLICVIFYVGSKIEQKSIQEVSIGKMKIILKIYTLIFLLALPSPYLKAHSPNELSLRRAKGTNGNFLKTLAEGLEEDLANDSSEPELASIREEWRIAYVSRLGTGAGLRRFLTHFIPEVYKIVEGNQHKLAGILERTLERLYADEDLELAFTEEPNPAQVECKLDEILEEIRKGKF